MTEEFLCVRCSRHMRTCCQFSEVYVSPGDLKRIEAHTGRADFTEFRAPVNPSYADQDDDPPWAEHVFRADGARRVLKRLPEGDCTFLGPHGCVMPLEVRPLVCRLYPFDYDANGIRNELSHGCPVELLKPGQGLLEALDMQETDAERWRAQLYQEILLEPREVVNTPQCVSD